MKIGDVSNQGDGNKAIFYYMPTGCGLPAVDKSVRETFRVRIDEQIGARQEAGRIGGTGPCGRELCCTTWMTNFSSVGTGAARLQNISPNPQKLAGMCAKLKCCLNYEVPVYEEASKKLPPRNLPLETKDGTYYLFATDPLKGEVTYSTAPRVPANLQVIVRKCKGDYRMNKREKPESLGGKSNHGVECRSSYLEVVGRMTNAL